MLRETNLRLLNCYNIVAIQSGFVKVIYLLILLLLLSVLKWLIFPELLQGNLCPSKENFCKLFEWHFFVCGSSWSDNKFDLIWFDFTFWLLFLPSIQQRHSTEFTKYATLLHPDFLSSRAGFLCYKNFYQNFSCHNVWNQCRRSESFLSNADIFCCCRCYIACFYAFGWAT